MKVILINGSPNENGTTNKALLEISKSLNEENIETEIIYLGRLPINDCLACGACDKLNKCVIDDCVNKVALKCKDADGFVFATPVYYAHPSGRILSFLDRLFYSQGEYLAYKPVVSVTVARRGGQTTSFDVLNKYATINHMPIISANYWNMVYGRNPSEAEKDFEGLDTMKNLGKNMAWILKCIKAGEEKGIKHPENKNRFTNFINN